MPTTAHFRLLLPVLLTLGGLLAFTGCATSSSVSGQDSLRTLTTSGNTHWVLAAWTTANGEQQAIDSPAPTMHIGYQGRISGNAGINDYVGTARVRDEKLNWGKSFAATRREGPSELIEREDRFLSDMHATSAVTVRGGRLVFSGDKALRLEFDRAHP